jgi:hypothetical protein
MDPTLETTEAQVLPTSTTSSVLAVTYAIFLYGLFYPVLWLLRLLRMMLWTPLWTILNVAALPFIRIGQGVYILCALPFRFLAKFEVSTRCSLDIT